MGEEDVKPKIEGGAARGRRQQRWQRRRNTPAKKEFKAPTPGLENMVFRQGDAADAAAFDDVKKALARYAGTNFKVGSQMAQVAIEDLEPPNIVKPTPPAIAGAAPTPMERAEQLEWEHELSAYFKEMEHWKSAGPRAYQLVMSHVDPDLEEKLESSASWAQIKQDQDVIALLKLVRSHVHKHDERKQGTMSLVEHDLDLYLNYQQPNQDLMTFYKLFKARCEVIDTFGGK